MSEKERMIREFAEYYETLPPLERAYWWFIIFAFWLRSKARRLAKDRTLVFLFVLAVVLACFTLAAAVM